jgi:hypothetical protein
MVVVGAPGFADGFSCYADIDDPKKPAPDLIGGGFQLSEKTLLKHEAKA